ncbi:MAG: cytochrome c [Myxococcota bacterium]|jgi:mono/diheme cytochrome c family protein|nr:cytochrome c [Myxococcota bacterium]
MRHTRRNGWRIPISSGARIGAALLLLATAFTRSAAAEEPPAAPSLLAASGESLYVRHCAVCHARTGRGDGAFAGILRTQPSDLTLIAARRGGTFPDAEIAGYVDGRLVPAAHGTREMPIWGRWLGTPLAEGTTEDEVARGEVMVMIEYLKSLQRTAPAGD